MARRNIGPAGLGLNKGPGKGDKSRVQDARAYNDNMSEIKLSGVPASQDPAFEQTGGKSVKRYGAAEPKAFVKLTGKIIVH